MEVVELPTAGDRLGHRGERSRVGNEGDQNVVALAGQCLPLPLRISRHVRTYISVFSEDLIHLVKVVRRQGV